MAILSWDDSLLTGNELVDTQHKGFFVILQDMVAKSGQTPSLVELRPFVDAITKYALIHFRTEEAFMDKVEYPYKQAHVMEHDGFLRTWATLLDRYSKEGDHTAMVLRFITEVAEWLQTHIRGHDMKLAKWAREVAPHTASTSDCPES